MTLCGEPMHVSISHHTIQKGFLFKTTYYEVQLSVAFSHEEKQIITQRRLQKTVSRCSMDSQMPS